MSDPIIHLDMERALRAGTLPWRGLAYHFQFIRTNPGPTASTHVMLSSALDGALPVGENHVDERSKPAPETATVPPNPIHPQRQICSPQLVSSGFSWLLLVLRISYGFVMCHKASYWFLFDLFRFLFFFCTNDSPALVKKKSRMCLYREPKIFFNVIVDSSVFFQWILFLHSRFLVYFGGGSFIRGSH